jgi:hypothetical protein
MEVLYGFIWENHGKIISGIYPLVICYIAMVKQWP